MSSSPQLVTEVEDQVCVEDRLFTITVINNDPRGGAGGVLPAPGALLALDGAKRLIVSTAAQDHYAAVRLQLWRGEPDTDVSATWEARDDSQIEVTVLPAQVRAMPLTARTPDSYLELDRTGTYHVRAYVTGRDELSIRQFERDLRGVERWLFQLWRDRSGTIGGAICAAAG